MAHEKWTEDQHRELAQTMYQRWEGGEPKSRLELEYWEDATSHGKAFSGYVKKWLGIDTERKSVQSLRVERLERLLHAHGIAVDPGEELSDESRLLARAREAALAALRVYNDPGAGFRTEAFILLMIVAWNSLAMALLEHRSISYLELEEGEPLLVDGRPRVLDTWQLINLALDSPAQAAVRWNLDFFLKLRHQVAHRYLPALDPMIVEEAQALLTNFENLISAEFGPHAALGDKLFVPLQLSFFTTSPRRQSEKRALRPLPLDVADFLTAHRRDVPDEVLRSPEYALRIFFVPITANRERSADAVVNFVDPDQVTSELAEQLERIAVVTKPRRVAVASGDLLRPSEVVAEVADRLPFRFTMDTHTRCWKHFNVRPASSAAEKETTDDRYCFYSPLSRSYGYTRAWVDKIVRDLSNADDYERIVGLRPKGAHGQGASATSAESS